MTPEMKKNLQEKAQASCEKAYAPYSNFRVGAAVLTKAGHLYTGCNVENVSYGLTICAERNAIFQAIAAEGPGMELKGVAVVTTNPGAECTPCGACRQVIAEFSKETVIFYKAQQEWQEAPLEAFLPSSFKMAI